MIKATKEKTKTTDSIDRILSCINNKRMTANECIDALFSKDVRSGKIETRSWKYYVHLNKLFSPLEKSGLVKVVGHKTGLTNRTEKIWSVK